MLLHLNSYSLYFAGIQSSSYAFFIGGSGTSASDINSDVPAVPVEFESNPEGRVLNPGPSFKK